MNWNQMKLKPCLGRKLKLTFKGVWPVIEDYFLILHRHVEPSKPIWNNSVSKYREGRASVSETIVNRQ